MTEVTRDKWLMGSVVAMGLVAAAAMWVVGVANSAAESSRRVSALETRLAVVETQRDEQRRALDEMKTEFRGQLSELNRKMDWMIRRVGGGKESQ
jgi:Flp pilus assembly protein TadB